MFQGRITMRRVLGSLIGLVAVIEMVGIGGAVEAGTISVAAAYVRMIIGCLLILGSAAMFGGLE